MKIFEYKKTLIFFLLIFVSLSAYLYFKPEKLPEFVTQKALIKDLEQIITVNGTVESNAKVRLRFQKPGKIDEISVKVGNNVKEGAKLARLDNAIIEAQVDQANANLQISEADLNLRFAGPSQEEIRVSEAQIEQAEVNLNNSKVRHEDIILTNAERKRKAELEFENAKILFENAEKSLDTSSASTTNSVEIAEKNLESSYIDSEPAIIISIDAVDRAITSADQIIGIDNKTANEDYRDRLGTSHPSANIDAINAYSKALIEFQKMKDEYDILKTVKSEAEQIIQDEKDAEAEQIIQAEKNAEKNIQIETDRALQISETTLFIVKDLLDKTYFLLDMTPTGFSFPLARQEELKSRIANEQSSISTNLQNVQKIIQRTTSAKLDLSRVEIAEISGTDDASSNFEKAKNNLLIAESNLTTVDVQNKIDENSAKMQIDLNEVALKQAIANHDRLIASPRQVDVASLRARVASSLSSLKQIQKELEDTVLKAPLEGIITEINAKVGENISTQETIIVMITDKMQIKVNISEIDINKIKLGNKVDISFDSLSESEIFEGKVMSINPAETVVDGVIYYEITVILEDDDTRIRSGMTADLDIHTAKREQVIAIPSLAVEYENRLSYCFVLENGKRIKRYIKVGIEGQDFVEVLEGIEAGEEIIIYEK
jgi:RND family efflux transporter MFP subunit